jgi:hypothetical protein
MSKISRPDSLAISRSAVQDPGAMLTSQSCSSKMVNGPISDMP